MKKGITINGKTQEIIESELRQPFSEEEFSETQDGFIYIPVEAYETRLNEVFGVLNYDRISKDGGIVEVLGDFLATATTTINIYDDDGNICLRKAAPGAAKLIVVNDSGRPKSIKSDIASAAAESFKNCCKQLQIGIDQVRSDRKGKRRENVGVTNSKNALGVKKVEDVKLQRVRLKTGFSCGKGYYYAEVVNISTNEEMKLMIFDRERPLIEAHMEFSDFVTAYGRDKEFVFYGYENSFRGIRQLIFTDVSVKGGV